MFIRWLDDVRAGDRRSVGGKCANLGELAGAGLPVPAGFAVTVEAFDAFRDGGGTALPPPVETELRTAYAALCASRQLVAVRSSAVAEDGDAVSFAGQHATYLAVSGADDVVAAVRSCWASLYAPRAIAYRAGRSAAAGEAMQMAVAVQAMVDAEVAGVAFTVSPRTGDRSVVAVNASWGLGHGVVSGEVTPDEYRLSKIDPKVIGRTVAHKITQWVPDPAGRGLIAVPVPTHRQDVACLDDDALRRLAEVAVRVERHFGCPQDIEWALERADANGPGRIVLLQSRPETSWPARRAEVRPQPSYLGVIQQVAAG